MRPKQKTNSIPVIVCLWGRPTSKPPLFYALTMEDYRMEQTLLLIDDDFQHVLDLKAILSPEIKILHAFNIRDASRLAANQQLSIVVKKMCAGFSDECFAFLSDLRAARPMPILLINTQSTEERTRAYHVGVDLCMDFPVNTTELAAAIRAMLRRYYILNRVAQFREAGMTIRHKELSMDPQRRTVIMRGQSVVLLAKEFDVLYFMIRHPGIVFSREQIYQHVWNEEHPYGSRSVADHICAIRKKLGLSPQDKEYIETIYHVGYRLTP